jgi:hypothetical protein
MSTPITHVTQAQPADQPAAARQPSPQVKPQPVPTDTVKLSAAASLRKELTETAVQTAREASQGDIQARNLLAKEAAYKKSGL